MLQVEWKHFESHTLSRVSCDDITGNVVGLVEDKDLRMDCPQRCSRVSLQQPEEAVDAKAANTDFCPLGGRCKEATRSNETALVCQVQKETEVTVEISVRKTVQHSVSLSFRHDDKTRKTHVFMKS